MRRIYLAVPRHGLVAQSLAFVSIFFLIQLFSRYFCLKGSCCTFRQNVNCFQTDPTCYSVNVTAFTVRLSSLNLGLFQGTKILSKPKMSNFRILKQQIHDTTFHLNGDTPSFDPQAQKLEQPSLYRIVNSTTWKKKHLTRSFH